MSTENTKTDKLITLDHISDIKEYIDSTNSTTIKTVDENLSNLDEALKQEIENNIASAREEIESDYNTKYNELTNKIQYVEEHGNKEELTKLQLELDALKATNEAQQNALTSLEDMVNGVKQNIYTPGELNKIIETALIDKTNITDDMIETPNLYTSNLVALIGRFGQISAANIIGDEITGHTIQSSNDSWKLNNDGSGKLANGNIWWNSSGDVTFDDNVKIKFSNVDGIEGGIHDVLDSISFVDLQTLQDAIEESNTRTDIELAELTAELTSNINSAKKDIDDKFNSTSLALSTQLINVNAALEKAIAAGDEAMAEKLQNVKNILTDEYSRLYKEYLETRGTLETLESEVGNLQESALSAEDIDDLISTSQIEKTEISGNKILTPSLLTKKIVALNGLFGTIKASKIIGTNIEGYTVSSPLTRKENGVPVQAKDDAGNLLYEQQEDENGNPMMDEDGNPIYASKLNPETGEYEPIPLYEKIAIEDAAWALESGGSGHLANGNISWNDKGVVTFGDNVTLSWNKITGTPDILTEDDKDDIVKTVITESGITANVIEGKTIKSIDDGKYWKIDANGSGKLAGGKITWAEDGSGTAAGGNIEWNAKGELTCKMNAGSVGGNPLVTNDMLDAIKVVIYDEYVIQQVKKYLTDYIKTRITDYDLTDTENSNNLKFKYICDLMYTTDEGDESQSIPYTEDIRTLTSLSTSVTEDKSSILMTLEYPENAGVNSRIFGARFYTATKLPNNFWDSSVFTSNTFTITDVFEKNLTITIKSADVSIYGYDADDNYNLSITTHAPMPTLEDMLLGGGYTTYSVLDINNVSSPTAEKFLVYIKQQSQAGAFNININTNVSFTKTDTTTNTPTTVNKQITIDIPLYINIKYKPLQQ